ncbi:ABC transporter ATP-binding protein [Natronorubrum texcoconense]|uniref:Amino acid/amide ABC transporter ATP-binding protein 2, HAAT family n=1 Tax=Natronorubrum texcoconense TaxID=1095776 RepID=A0A1G8X1S0_9EURY|nr:ABC transporter ATP-binding protein [Natronorubrum texcoconense]SDJ84384.1 amino acid/amide ABC transporter ATP-binding protein 2, HAAT family [Natronorubrum texcoconense]
MSDSTTPHLEIDDLHVYYGKAHALQGVSIDVDNGEIFGVIGPNGAGKTTMLNAIAGFLEYDGSIHYDGVDLATVSPRDIVTDGLVYCTEDRDLFPFFTVHENLQMGAQFRDDREAVEEDMRMVYDLFPRLDERRDQEAETMSGGEQQMLAIGRALMSDPDLLMLDEPTLGLAPIIIEDINDAIEKLNQEEGLTILLAEQNSTFALRHAERLALLETGSIELAGSAAEFQDNDYIREAYIGIH